jgi:hypothetical protein
MAVRLSVLCTGRSLLPRNIIIMLLVFIFVKIILKCILEIDFEMWTEDESVVRFCKHGNECITFCVGG